MGSSLLLILFDISIFNLLKHSAISHHMKYVNVQMFSNCTWRLILVSTS